MDNSLKYNLERMYAACSDRQLASYHAEFTRYSLEASFAAVKSVEETLALIQAEQLKRLKAKDESSL